MVFPGALSQCSSLKRRLFCENQPIFVVCLPINFFYFANFRWPFFGKMIGQKQQMALPKKNKKTAPFIEDSWLVKQKKKKIVLHHQEPFYNGRAVFI